MRKDSKFIFCLMAFWLLGILIFSFLPRDHRTYQSIKDDRIRSIVQQIHHLDNIDIAFLGSSRTMNGINTAKLSHALDMDVYNFACNWYGQDLWLSILKHIKNKHQPKYIFVEANFLRRYNSHVNLKNVAPMEDVVSTPIGKSYLTNLLYSFPRTLLQWSRSLFHQYNFDEFKHHGWVPQNLPKELITTTRQVMAEHLAKGPLSEKYIEPQNKFKKTISDLRLSQQRNCYLEMQELCQDGHLIILPMPKIAISQMSESMQKEWNQLGELLYLPPGMLDHAEYWRDEAHLNTTGANTLTDYLAKYIKNRESELKL
jgi:hypothetical protein